MKKICVYTQSGVSGLCEFLKRNEANEVKNFNLDQINTIEDDQDLVIIEADSNYIANLAVRTKFVFPTLFVTDKILPGLTVRGEAYDFILTPVNYDELKVRVKNLLKIKELIEQIKVVSTTDELTGLYNRTYFHQRLESELSRSKRYNIPLSCILIDIDYFKTVNDIYGYDWGDVLLKAITEVLKKHARKEDIVTRYGDEEFMLLLPCTDEESAYIFADRLRADIAQMEFIPDGEEERHIVTISGGISSYPFPADIEDETAQTLVRYAEHSLYAAKTRGKNKIVQFTQMNMEM
jgi:two-component system, cell cycle response regulator